VRSYPEVVRAHYPTLAPAAN